MTQTDLERTKLENSHAPVADRSQSGPIAPIALLMPPPESGPKVDLSDLLQRLTFRRWPYAVGMATALLFAVFYLWASRPMYRIHAVLEPVRSSSMRPSGLGALLGGEIGGDMGSIIGGGGGTNLNLAMALMVSDEFLAQFILDNQLRAEIAAGSWNARIRGRNGSSISPWKAVEIFREENFSIAENKHTGLVQISLIWPDAVAGKTLVKALVTRVNERLRERRVAELTRSIEYLRKQLAESSGVEVRQAVGGALQMRMSEASLVGTRDDFALAFVDEPASPPPSEVYSPRPIKTFALAAALGAFASALVTLLMWTRAQRPASPAS